MDLRLSVRGDDPVGGLEELLDSLRREPELRGLITMVYAPPAPGALGALGDALVAAVGSGGAVTALAASLKLFLTQPRRSEVHIVVTGADGRREEIHIKGIDDVEPVLRRLVEPPR